jgi:tRNA 2-thiouridine synthesizing protein D
MKFVLQINSSPWQSNAGRIAYQFISTALAEGHQVLQVFFYHDGIFHALRYATPPDDEMPLMLAWQALAEHHAVDLVVCVSAAQRRGLLATDEARRQGKQDDDLAAGFRIGGLSQFIAATLAADRVMVFG